MKTAYMRCLDLLQHALKPAFTPLWAAAFAAFGYAFGLISADGAVTDQPMVPLALGALCMLAEMSIDLWS